jgi:adenosine deaminase
MDNPTLWPLVDLHRHLEGAVRPETVLEISLQHGLELPTTDLAELKRHVYMFEPITDILTVLPKFNLLRQVFVDYEACRRVTMECIQDAWQEGLDYIEVRFSPYFMAEMHGLDAQSVTSAVCEGWEEMERQQPHGSRLIAILSRTYGPEICEIELECALAHRERGVVGLDLAGDEARHPAGQFRQLFDRARDAGLHLTAHAGEFAGSQSVRETIEALQPERIGHGVHAVDDQAVMDLIFDHGVAIESCPTSNYYTQSVPSLREHPLPKFLEQGLCVSLNTDDPTLFQEINIQDEYRVAQEQIGIDAAGLDRIRMNGFESAFLSKSERMALANRVAGRLFDGI